MNDNKTEFLTGPPGQRGGETKPGQAGRAGEGGLPAQLTASTRSGHTAPAAEENEARSAYVDQGGTTWNWAGGFDSTATAIKWTETLCTSRLQRKPFYKRILITPGNHAGGRS